MGIYIKVFLNPMNKVVEVKKGTKLLDVIRDSGITFRNICGGRGECGMCRVILNKGEISYVSNKYKNWLSDQEISEGITLACFTRVQGTCQVTIPIESRIFNPKILLNAKSFIGKLDPASKKYLLESSNAENLRKGLFKLKDYKGLQPRVSKDLLNMLFLMDKEKVVTTTLTITDGSPKIINFEAGDRTRTNYGLAIDLGTTTVVVSIIDLTTGNILDNASELNRQITYGEALVSRISYGANPEGLEKLQELAVKSINNLIKKLTSRLGICETDITDICIGGNTVMNHLLAAIDPSYLTYVDGNEKVSRNPIIRKIKILGIKSNPEGYVYCLPNVSRFLGGDVIGDVLTSGMHESGELSLLVDMGTNGEIVFGNKDWLMSCSCASGPAFEGGGIRFGMRAMQGGIEHVRINRDTFIAECSIIGDKFPRGICGSGIIDAAAEMFLAGILDFSGKIVKLDTPLVRKGKYGLEYVLVPAIETSIQRDIVISQRDMDYLMDSKAATCGAIIVLMRKLKVSIDHILNVYLAGAFGSYTNLQNLVRFGIFPEFPKAKIHPLGNGSIAGAYAALSSLKERKKAEEISKNMFYVDLLVDPMFSEAYLESIYIPGKKEFFPTYGS
jgi:uncharacterized 2Fe-2S/4Fe-4S cluster protein (DUF4445 family)